MLLDRIGSSSSGIVVEDMSGVKRYNTSCLKSRLDMFYVCTLSSFFMYALFLASRKCLNDISLYVYVII